MYVKVYINGVICHFHEGDIIELPKNSWMRLNNEFYDI